MRMRLLILGLLQLMMLVDCNCDEDLQRILPRLEANPAEVTVSDALVAQDNRYPVELCSVSSAEVEIISIQLAEDSDPSLRLENTEIDRIRALDCHVFWVVIRPSAEQIYSGQIIIEAGEETLPESVIEVPIEIESIEDGLPIIQVEPAAIDFGQQPVGRVSRRTITISNVGNRPLQIDRVMLGDDSSSAFSVASELAAREIEPDTSIEAEVIYLPPEEGLFEDTLTIMSNDPVTASVDVQLSGETIECPQPMIEIIDAPDPIKVFDRIRFDGRSSSSPNGEIVDYTWEVVSAPIGFAEDIHIPELGLAEILFSIGGTYRVALSVIDSTETMSCEQAMIELFVEPDFSLDIQLSWAHPTADMDLHLVRADGDLFNPESDVYFSNDRPNWYMDNPDANPRLSGDVDDGYGPEQIVVASPLPGEQFDIYAHYWRQNDNPAAPVPEELEATIRVFAYGQAVGTFVRTLETEELMWHVASFTWPEVDGVLPELTSINTTRAQGRPF